MKLRSKDRFCYRTYHLTGEKVYLTESGANMDLNNVVLEECKIMEDINHSLSLYELSELYCDEEVKEAYDKLMQLSQKYRHVHVELKALLGGKYEEKYPLYQNTYDRLMAYVKGAKERLRNLRAEVLESHRAVEKNSLETELSVLISRVAEENTNLDPQDCQDVHEIDQYILKMEKFLDEFFQLKTKMLLKCPDDFKTNFSSTISENTVEIRQDIKMAKILRQTLAKKKAQEADFEVFQRDQPMYVNRAENLNSEISYRFKSLSKKFNLDLENLSDHQLLEINQDKTLHSEFNDVLEKVTELASLVTLGGHPVESLLAKVCKTRDRIASKKDEFFDSLQKVIVERDISVEKIKNASGLKIDLPKFSGYDGSIDFFTFKSEFKRLVESSVQKKFWVDHLKRNYLSGQALTLVEAEKDYEKIWKRLQESFGCARLMLQNKLSLLSKMGGLYQMKGEQKLGSAIAKLCNSMQDLSKLAKDHNLERQLYEGGGLEQVMSLIGETRHRRFRSENASATLSKKQTWQKLFEFLGKEQVLTERLVLDQKNAELMGFSLKKPDKKKDPKIDGSSRALVSASSKSLCHICGKDGHTTITTKKGNVIVPYYVCEQFVKMSAAERFSLLTSKNLCTVCLYPGAPKKHGCYFKNFCCPSHDKNDQVHVLVCEKHKTEKRNLDILEKFKGRFIQNCPVTLPGFVKGLTFYSGLVGFGNVTHTYDFDFENLIPDSPNRSIFHLQSMNIEGDTLSFNLFFDNGCGDLVVSSSAVKRLAAIGRAIQIIAGPLTIKGIGGQTCISHDGVYAICLPLFNGQNAVLSGLVLPTITGKFPTYQLTNVENDIRKRCQEVGKPDFSVLPRLPKSVGGDTDILIGSKYLRYFPTEIHRFESGLTVCESIFTSTDGTRGIIGGPHAEWEQFEKAAGVAMSNVAYHASALIVRQSWTIERDMPLLGG